jgi:ankyrin repeat protein
MPEMPLGNLEVIAYLIKSGAELELSNLLGVTPVQEASRYGFEDVVRLLIDRGADFTRQSLYGSGH